MRDRMERFAVLPFSMGCVSHASVAVVEQRPRRSKDLKSPSLSNREEDEGSLCRDQSMKHYSSSRFLTLAKPNISTGVNKIVKGFKSLSQLFIYEDEMEGLGMEMEMEMEIGCPTDVKHVTHIGWDGTASTNPVMGWDNLIAPELLFDPAAAALSLNQFELYCPTTAGAETESPPSPPPQLAKASSGSLIELNTGVGGSASLT